jgi:hypothetical protein
MQKKLLLVLVLLGAMLGVGAAAIAQSAKPDASASLMLGKMHQNNGLTCETCHGAGKKTRVPMAKCVTCHETKALAKRTENVKPNNPHNSRHYGTEADCNLCHHQHVKSEDKCAECHKFNFKVP